MDDSALGLRPIADLGDLKGVRLLSRRAAQETSTPDPQESRSEAQVEPQDERSEDFHHEKLRAAGFKLAGQAWRRTRARRF